MPFRYSLCCIYFLSACRLLNQTIQDEPQASVVMNAEEANQLFFDAIEKEGIQKQVTSLVERAQAFVDMDRVEEWMDAAEQCIRQLDTANPTCRTFFEQATCRSGLKGIYPFVAVQVNLGTIVSRAMAGDTIPRQAVKPLARRLIDLFIAMGVLGAKHATEIVESRLLQILPKLLVSPGVVALANLAGGLDKLAFRFLVYIGSDLRLDLNGGFIAQTVYRLPAGMALRASISGNLTTPDIYNVYTLGGIPLPVGRGAVYWVPGQRWGLAWGRGTKLGETSVATGILMPMNGHLGNILFNASALSWIWPPQYERCAEEAKSNLMVTAFGFCANIPDAECSAHTTSSNWLDNCATFAKRRYCTSETAVGSRQVRFQIPRYLSVEAMQRAYQLCESSALQGQCADLLHRGVIHHDWPNITQPFLDCLSKPEGDPSGNNMLCFADLKRQLEEQ